MQYKEPPKSSRQMKALDDSINEGVKRAGRATLWVALPPVGLWRSVRHGKKKHEDRLAKKIAQELNS